MSKLKSSTLWLSIFSLAIISLIILTKSDWAVSIGTALTLIPIAYVGGNKLITTSAINAGQQKEV